MELPRRDRGAELLKPGALAGLRQRLRRMAPGHDLTSVIVYAFDHRTRMLPFIFADTRMVPAGVRAIGSAMADSGFEKTRIVLQQWNRHFRPSRMRLDGRIPDLFMVSSMSMHVAPCLELIRDAHRIDPSHRPLIIAGGPLCIYQPYTVFSADPENPASADVAVTGEEYVLLSLLEVLLSIRARGESMRGVFIRARDSGALDGIPGLVYAKADRRGVAEALVNTGVQQLLGDLDELSDSVLGYGLLEAPSRDAELDLHAVPASRVRKLSPLASIVLTCGCKFSCPYCPIPGYNQRQLRTKSGGRMAQEMWRIYKEYGITFFFGTDDNFFNNKQRTLDVVQTLATAEFDGTPLRKKTRWATEVTVHDTLQMNDHLKLIRDSGCRALWLGVEDMTATLVKKGQSGTATTDAFRRLRAVGICPMPMMMHHDSQPLYTRQGDYGLLNQVKLLRKAGAVSLQVLMITPSPGSKLFESTYESGHVFESVGGTPVLPYMHHGSLVIASHARHPWRKQINLLVAYLYFYNPIWLIAALRTGKTKIHMRHAVMQIFGMLGLILTGPRMLTWAIRLKFGKIKRLAKAPTGPIPVIAPSEKPCSVAPPVHGRHESAR